MTNFAAKIAGVATLALAVLPVAALTTAAHAQPRAQVVRVADLDLSTKAGHDAFEARVHKASRAICRDARTLGENNACEAGVRTEAQAKLAEYLNSRSAPTVLAAAR